MPTEDMKIRFALETSDALKSAQQLRTEIEKTFNATLNNTWERDTKNALNRIKNNIKSIETTIESAPPKIQAQTREVLRLQKQIRQTTDVSSDLTSEYGRAKGVLSNMVKNTGFSSIMSNLNKIDSAQKQIRTSAESTVNAQIAQKTATQQMASAENDAAAATKNIEQNTAAAAGDISDLKNEFNNTKNVINETADISAKFTQALENAKSAEAIQKLRAEYESAKQVLSEFVTPDTTFDVVGKDAATLVEELIKLTSAYKTLRELGVPEGQHEAFNALHETIIRINLALGETRTGITRTKDALKGDGFFVKEGVGSVLPNLNFDATKMDYKELIDYQKQLNATFKQMDKEGYPKEQSGYFEQLKRKIIEVNLVVKEYETEVKNASKNTSLIVLPDLSVDVTKLGWNDLQVYADQLKSRLKDIKNAGTMKEQADEVAQLKSQLALADALLKQYNADLNKAAKSAVNELRGITKKPEPIKVDLDADTSKMEIGELTRYLELLKLKIAEIKKEWKDTNYQSDSRDEEYRKSLEQMEKTKSAIRECKQEFKDTGEKIDDDTQATLNFADAFKLVSDAIVSVGHSNNILEQLKAILLTIGPTAQMAGWLTKDALTMATAGINLLIEVASRLITIVESIGQAFKTLASTIWTAFTKALDILKRVANYLKNTLMKAADKARNAFDKIRDSLSVSISGSDLRRTFQMLTKYIFGVRSFFFLYRKLRTAVKEGLENLVQFEHESNQTSKAILELKSSLLFLKNAWAAAFAPIINAVYPWLVSLLNLLARVGNAIARFVAALTGQSTVLQALRLDAEEYSDALDDLGGGADDASKKQDKLNDRLAAFDDLNVLGRDDDKNTTGGGGGGGGADPDIDPNEMFERVRVKMDELMRVLREAWETGDAFELGQMLAQRLSDSLDEAYTWLTKEGWDKVMKVARFIASLMDGLLSNDELPGKIGKVLAAAFDLGLTFIDTIITPERMYKIGVRIAEVFNEALPKIFPKIGEAIGNHLRSVISNAWGFISTADFASWGDALGEAINNFFEEMGTSKGILGGIEFTHSGWQLLGLSVTELAKGILDFFIEAINTVDWNEVGKAIGDFLGSIDFASIKSGLMTLWGRIKEGLGEVWEGLGDSNPELATWLEPLVTVLQELPGLLNDIKDVLSALFNPDGVSPEKRMAQITQFVQDLPDKLEDFFDVLSRIADVLETVFGRVDDLMGDAHHVTRSTAAGAIMGGGLGLFTGNPALALLGALAGGGAGAFTGVVTSEGTREGFGKVIDGLQEEAERTNGIADVITASFGAIGNAFNLLGENAQIPGVHNAIMDLITTSLNAKDSINEMKGAFNFSDVTDNFNSMVSQAKGSLNEIPDKFTEIKGAAETRGNEMKGQFSTTFESIKTESVDSAKIVQDNFTLASDNIKTSFIGAWEEIKKSVSEGGSLFVALSDGMGNTVKSLLNGMIDGINVSITKPLQDISNSFNILRGLDVDGKKPFAGIPVLRVPTIPRLAQGAVIPPNREFMAVLGDQKSGTNIEAPLDTIRQAVGEEFAPYADAIVNAVMQVVQAVNDKPVISNRDIGRANAQYVSQQKLIRGTML